MRIRTLILALLPLSAMGGEWVLENDYFRVSRDAVQCAQADARACIDRVIVALAALDLDCGSGLRQLARGDVAVFGDGESYLQPLGGSFLEIVIKPAHPQCQPPGEWIAAEKNALLHDGGDFIVSEEQLAPGDTRARHSHCQRLVVQLNATRLHQWPDGAPEKFVDTVPDLPLFAPAVVHTVNNVGSAPLRGIVVEFKRR